MSHVEQRIFIEEILSRFPNYFKGVKVLEVGSLDINGTVRDFFNDCDYLGVDLGEGPGVDLVAEGQNLDFPDNDFSTVISAECFEHNPYWRQTFQNMHRMCSGLVIVTAATVGRVEHGTHRSMPHASPLTLDKWDYYANISLEDLTSLPLNEMFLIWDIQINKEAHDIYFWGITRSALEYHLNGDNSILKNLSEKLDQTRQVVEFYTTELNNLKNSKSWRYTEKMRVISWKLSRLKKH